MYMSRSFLTIYESNDVRVMKSLEDMDLRVKIFFQLFIELVHIDRLDGDELVG